MHFPLVLAAGSATRFGSDKLLLRVAGKPVLEHTLERVSCRFAGCGTLVSAAETMRQHAPLLPSDWDQCAGGELRGQSVALGLEHIARHHNPQKGDWVWIFDAARPAINVADIDAIKLVADKSQALLGVVAVDQPSSSLVGTDKGRVTASLPRDSFRLTSTPQVFRYGTLVAAYRDNVQATDDLQAVLASGVAGDAIQLHSLGYPNPKLTSRADLVAVSAQISQMTPSAPELRVGLGVDTHRLAPGTGVVLGCVAIPCELRIEAHSDGDVLAHAVMDALLGAAALGDLGKYFPGDEKNRDRSGRDMLEEVVAMLHDLDYSVTQVDSVVICQKPKLAPYISQMREQLAHCLRIPIDAVSVKATTTDGVGPEGEGKALTAHASAVVVRSHPIPEAE